MSPKVRGVEIVDSKTGRSDRAGVDGCCRRGRRTSIPGREDQFATGGSDPWQDIGTSSPSGRPSMARNGILNQRGLPVLEFFETYRTQEQREAVVRQSSEAVRVSSTDEQRLLSVAAARPTHAYWH